MSLTTEEIRRYARHIILPEVGGRGQLKLKQGAVALVGLGGVASVAGLYLAAAGVGRLVLEPLPGQAITGAWWTPGAEAAALQEANPALAVEQVAPGEAMAPVAIVVAGDLAAAQARAGALRAAGAVVVAVAATPAGGGVTLLADGTPCPACWAAQVDGGGAAATGLTETVPGVLGSLAATEAIKALLAMGEGLTGRLLAYDAAAGRFAERELTRRPGCTCGSDGVL